MVLLKRIRRTVLVLLLISLHGLCYATLSKVNVIDAFLAIDGGDMPSPREYRENLLAYAQVDQEHGYIKYVARDNSENFEFAIFQKSDGTVLAAMSWGPGDCIDVAPETCWSSLTFFQKFGVTWKNIGHTPLPQQFNKHLIYQLPREGRTIVIKRKNGSVVNLLAFDGSVFRLASAKHKRLGKQ